MFPEFSETRRCPPASGCLLSPCVRQLPPPFPSACLHALLFDLREQLKPSSPPHPLCHLSSYSFLSGMMKPQTLFGCESSTIISFMLLHFKVLLSQKLWTLRCLPGRCIWDAPVKPLQYSNDSSQSGGKEWWRDEMKFWLQGLHCSARGCLWGRFNRIRSGGCSGSTWVSCWTCSSKISVALWARDLGLKREWEKK